jgi:hypothetical protein
VNKGEEIVNKLEDPHYPIQKKSKFWKAYTKAADELEVDLKSASDAEVEESVHTLSNHVKPTGTLSVYRG